MVRSEVCIAGYVTKGVDVQSSWDGARGRGRGSITPGEAGSAPALGPWKGEARTDVATLF